MLGFCVMKLQKFPKHDFNILLQLSAWVVEDLRLSVIYNSTDCNFHFKCALNKPFNVWCPIKCHAYLSKAAAFSCNVCLSMYKLVETRC